MPDYKPEEERQERSALMVSVDGKSIRSTGKMRKYQGNALHIVSAQLAKLGLTFAQQTVDSKSNEIPTAQALPRSCRRCHGCFSTISHRVLQSGRNCAILMENKEKATFTENPQYAAGEERVMSYKNDDNTFQC